MRCKLCHKVLKRPAQTSKNTLTCFSCRKQLEIAQIIQSRYKQDSEK